MSTSEPETSLARLAFEMYFGYRAEAQAPSLIPAWKEIETEHFGDVSEELCGSDPSELVDTMPNES